LWQGSFASIADIKQEGMQSATLAVAVLLIGVGLFAFFAVLLRLT
jgi:putative membrane protein